MVRPPSWKRFWRAVDNEGVALFQTVGYFVLSFGAGLYNLFFAKFPAPAVQGVMGQPYYQIWLGLLLVMPVVCLIGKTLKGDLTFTGMLAQFLGDLGTAATLLLFTISSALTTDWGSEGNVGGFSTLILFLCTVIFILRDVRRLFQVECRANP